MRVPPRRTAALRDRWRPWPKPTAHGTRHTAHGKIVPSRPAPAAAPADSTGISGVRLPGREAERFGMRPAAVPGQDLTGFAGPVRDGAVADLAAHDWKMRNSHREAAGT